MKLIDLLLSLFVGTRGGRHLRRNIPPRPTKAYWVSTLSAPSSSVAAQIATGYTLTETPTP